VKPWPLSAVLALAGCATVSLPPQPAAPSESTVEQRVQAITAAAQRSQNETDPKVRAELAQQASGEAQACLAAQPRAAGCLYADALALGLEARAHPAHAGDSLSRMLTELTAAEAADPAYDHAGPARVRAIVLVRAPGWPLGPGDTGAAVDAAQRAVALRPHYPPNLLALGEALAKNGDALGARAAYQRAREEALTQPPDGNREEWVREADRALQH
jgi:hypothetical protein